jgi:hypothetical protein
VRESQMLRINLKNPESGWAFVKVVHSQNLFQTSAAIETIEEGVESAVAESLRNHRSWRPYRRS